MKVDINNPDFIEFCQTATQLEVAEKVINGSVRGLDKLALKMLWNRKKLSNIVVNMLVVYFFSAFRKTVYHRHDLSLVYNYWASRNVNTFLKAKQMMEEDIHELLATLKSARR